MVAVNEKASSGFYTYENFENREIDPIEEHMHFIDCVEYSEWFIFESPRM